MAPWSDLRELRSASGIKMECLFWTPGSSTLSLWQPCHLRRLNTPSWYQHQRQAVEIQLVDFLVHRALLPFTALLQQARLDSRSKRSRFQRIHGGEKGISHGESVSSGQPRCGSERSGGSVVEASNKNHDLLGLAHSITTHASGNKKHRSVS